MDVLIDELHAAAPADAAKPVLVAGDPEAQQCAQRLRDGIPIPPALGEQLRAVCLRCNVPYLMG
jgi:LDH2 family malate/lactate/ureidoglycolate dehydrogenase